MMDTVPPKDKFQLIYFSIIVLMSATVMAWKSLASGVDYFQYLYPNYRSEIVIPLALNVTGLLSILVNLATLHLVSFYKRMMFTTSVFFVSLLSIPLMDIWIHNCTLDLKVAYGITVLIVVLISIALAVQQSSIFGLSGMLPPHYTQASSVGVSLSGIIACVCRIITKASFKEERVGAIAFFVLALLMIGIGVICTFVLRFSKFVRYYVEKAKTFDKTKSKETTTNGDIDMESLMDDTDDVVIDEPEDNNIIVKVSKLKNSKTKLHIQRLRSVIRNTWKVIIAVFVVYIVTIMIYPSLMSEVQYCAIGDWSPVVLITAFSVMDFIGRLLTLLPYKMSPNWLFVASLSRLFLIPLIIICISPSPTDPLVSSGASLWLALPIALCVGFTNGYIGTTGLIIGPTLVEPHSKELAGTMLIFNVFLAQSVGSGLAYAVNPLTTIDVNIPCVENYTATFNCLLNGNYSEF